VRPVTLNLASRPFRNNTVVGSALGIAGMALVLASAYNLYVFLSYGSSYAQLQREQADDRVKIASLQVEERRLVEEIRKRNFKKVFEEGKIASELIVKGSFSWTRLFNTLETVIPPDIVMTAIRPNITNEGIVMRIEGIAKNHGALLTFETRLQQSPVFAKVFPANERRLNPSLPDITFLLTCDYLPKREAAPDQVAAATKKDGAAGKAVGQASAAAGAPAPPVQHAAGATPDASTSKKQAPAPAGSIVGRDGVPRDRRAAGSPTLAPGGLYVPALEVAAVKLAARKDPARGGGSRTAASEAGAQKPAVPVPGEQQPRVAAPATTKRSRDTGPLPPQPPPARVPQGPKGYDPNVPHTMSPDKQAAIAAAQARADKRTVPATRLDVPLTFVGRPVSEVYQRLSEAHGVRFDLDSSVDRNAPVTVNLRGRKLEDAILLIAGTARHKVKRVADGVYKVTPDEGGRGMGEAPVSEEPIREGGS
jgi:hypothetical protein